MVSISIGKYKEGNAVFQLVLILVVFCYIKYTKGEVTADENIQGVEGESLNTTVTFSNISLSVVKILTHALPENQKYNTLCILNNGACIRCSQYKGSNIIASVCSDKEIIWTFNPLKTINQGRHKIEVKSIDGNQIDKYLQVNVLAGPKSIALSCNHMNITEDTSLNCTCTAISGNPKPSVSWSLIDGSDSFNPSSDSNTPDFDIFKEIVSYVSYRVKVEDNGGKLRCEVKNSYGSLNKTVQLNVKYKPRINTSSLSLIVNESETVNLQCKAIGNPEPNITWTFPDGTKKEGKSLQIESIKRNAAGSYLCTAKNELGDASELFNITVRYPPSCERLNDTKIAVTDSLKSLSDIMLACSARSLPLPTFLWLIKNSTSTIPIDKSSTNSKYQYEETSSSQHQMTTTYLTVRSASQGDEATYECHATNSLGSCDTFINLTVPSVPDRVTNLRIDNEGSNSIKCQWTPGYNGGLSQNFTVSYGAEDHAENVSISNAFIILQIADFKPNTEYDFSVTPYNELGPGTDSEIIQYKAPDIEVPQNVEIDENKKLIKFSKTSIPYCVQIFYKKSKLDEDWSLELECGDSTKGEVSINHVSGYYCVAFCSSKFKESCSKKVEKDYSDKPSPLSGGVIAGIVIGCLLVIGLIVFLIIYFVKIKPRNSPMTYKYPKSDNPHTNHRNGGPPEFNMSIQHSSYPDNECHYAQSNAGISPGYSNRAFDSAERISNGSSVDVVYKTAGHSIEPPSYDKLEEIGISIKDPTIPKPTDDDHIYSEPTKPRTSDEKQKVVYEAVV